MKWKTKKSKAAAPQPVVEPPVEPVTNDPFESLKATVKKYKMANCTNCGGIIDPDSPVEFWAISMYRLTYTNSLAEGTYSRVIKETPRRLQFCTHHCRDAYCLI